MFDFPNSPSVGQVFAPAGGPTYTWDGVKWVAGQAAASYLTFAAQGRLTLTSGVPVLYANVTGATSILYVPYTGLLVPVWNGTFLAMVSMGGELSQALSDATKSPAASVVDKTYDIFFWLDGTTPRISRGPPWSSNTVRGTGAGTTELARIGGIYVNGWAITNGPAAQRGTYLGSIRTHATIANTIDFSIGGAAVGGVNVLINVWNCYNRLRGLATSRNTHPSYTTSGTLRPLGGFAERLYYLSGLSEDTYAARLTVLAQPAASTNVQIGIGYDTGSAMSPQFGIGQSSVAAQMSLLSQGSINGDTTGYHLLSSMENSNATTPTVFLNTFHTFTLEYAH